MQRVKNAFVRKKAEAHQENPVVLSLARAGVKVRDLSKNEGQIAESYYNYNLVEFGDLLLNPMDLYSGANCSISMVEEGILKGSENTSRGRSLLFLCAALSVAGILGENVPVYIPENGFIGLNIPLTGGRKGTCSTRTTHPYFLRQFNGILEQVGIKNTITNFFAYNTKREIVGQVKDTDAFKSCYADTISCSHPCLARYNKKGSKEYPVNCGYCYPCLIRKSSLLDIDEIKKYSYQGEAYDFLIEYEESEKSADLRAVLGSIYRCKHSSDKELKRYIRCVGELTEEEVEKFLSLYKKSIEDLVQLFSADQRMKEYLGL